MRTAFVETLFELARRDPRIVLIVGDLGFDVVTSFMEQLPAQFVNAGVAEQNMTSMAAGMALSGKKVFTYSIANFPTLRCLEQIRNDVCYHHANVTIVAVGGGLSYGAMGPSHHATEELAVMRALPDITVIAPGDPVEARLATHAILEHEGPCYLRLGKAGEPVAHRGLIDFKIGKAIQLREGDDLTLISTGALLPVAVEVADRFAANGIHIRLLSMHTLKPIDTDAVLAAACETRAIATLEEHSITGGLGSAVAEVIAEAGYPRVPFRRIGLPNSFPDRAGSQIYLRDRYGLTAQGIEQSLQPLLTTSKKTLVTASIC